MRTAWLFSVVVAPCLIGQVIAAEAVNSAATAPAVAAAANPQATSLDAAQIIAARPDRDRYYWHDGQWWYFTTQNNWLRWNGVAWVPFVNVQTGARSAYPASAAGEVAAPSYRYSINMYRAGL